MNHRLTLPERTTKPRVSGRTHVLDKGSGLVHLRDELEVIGGFVDLVKLGWGTSIVTPNLEAKLAVYRERGIEVCFGGTLFEVYVAQRKVDDYAQWLTSLDLRTIEISDGTLTMEPDERHRLIERFAKRFRVLSEVGSKDDTAIVSPRQWVRAIKADLEAGAEYVILEGRESGTAGLYRTSGEIRMGLVQDILDSGIPPEKIVFEAPLKAQQVYMIGQLGANVNLANIPPSEVVALETLRLGLRSDTLAQFHRDA